MTMCRRDALQPIFDLNEEEDHISVSNEEREAPSELDYDDYIIMCNGTPCQPFRPCRPCKPFMKMSAPMVIFLKALGVAAAMVGLAYNLPSSGNDQSVVRVAMVGNSMMYFNDLPRVLQRISKFRIEQNSCLHGNADFTTHLYFGNGMYTKWQTGQARLWNTGGNRKNNNNDDDNDDVDRVLYDFGACTVQQLLFGKDDRIMSHQGEWYNATQYKEVYSSSSGNNISYEEAWQYDLSDDGENPCLVDKDYSSYMETLYYEHGPPKWDYVLFNDNTRTPCCTDQRAQSIEMLKNVYLPWIKEIKAVPIFMTTYGYWASKRDMSGLTDIPTFSSYTWNGYQDYLRAAEEYLPASLKPRIAPVGPAFLMVWEENPEVWTKLIHSDEIHASPSGTFLKALIVHHTIFGKLPDYSVFDSDSAGPDALWATARRMSPIDDWYSSYPSRDMARYLYHIAHRICVRKEMPRSLTIFPANTSVDFIPDDSSYTANPQQQGNKL